jgi:hypothetical protein
MTDLQEEKRLPFVWTILGGIALWVVFGVTFYTIGSMLRGALL